MNKTGNGLGYFYPDSTGFNLTMWVQSNCKGGWEIVFPCAQRNWMNIRHFFGKHYISKDIFIRTTVLQYFNNPYFYQQSKILGNILAFLKCLSRCTEKLNWPDSCVKWFSFSTNVRHLCEIRNDQESEQPPSHCTYLTKRWLKVDMASTGSSRWHSTLCYKNQIICSGLCTNTEPTESRLM